MRLVVIVASMLVLSQASPGVAAGGIGSPVTVSSSSTTSTVVTPVVAGATYRLIATGQYVYQSVGGIPLVADAECATGQRSPDPTAFGQDPFDLYVDGSAVDWNPLSPSDALQRCAADSDRTYSLDYTAQTTSITLSVNDSSKAENTGSLSVWVACAVSWPSGSFIHQTAINDAANETASAAAGCPNGSTFKPSSFRSAQNIDFPAADGYTCSKVALDPALDSGRSFGSLSQASMQVDTRENVYDPVNPSERFYSWRGYTSPSSGYYATSPATYYKQAGHWGIRTCNWTKLELDANNVPVKNYRIVVKGTYRYDSTTSGSYGLADAECATGYRESSATQTTYDKAYKADWPDQFIPSHYTYFTDKLKANAVTGTVNPSPRRPYQAAPLDLYGTTFKPHRFDFWPSADQSLTDTLVDPFDLLSGVQGEADLHDWKPLQVSGGQLVSMTGDCSTTDHAYYVDVAGEGKPLHLAMWDLVRYNEWDNCGTLSVKITTDLTSFPMPDAPAAGPGDCHSVANPPAYIVGMRDTNDKDPSQPFYFDPTKTVVEANSFKVSDGSTVPTTIYWQTREGVHTVHSSVNVDGEDCGVPNLATGNDDCDDPATGPGSKRRLIRWEANQVAEKAGNVDWQFDLNATARSALCANGYCVIPYFCKIRPDFMRATLVIEL